MENERQIRTQAALVALERTRAELRMIFEPDQTEAQTIEPNTFPRSKTFRWAMSHPVSRLFGGGTLGGTVTRMLITKYLGSLVFGRRS
jgi:hypothetical protein